MILEAGIMVGFYVEANDRHRSVISWDFLSIGSMNWEGLVIRKAKHRVHS